MIAGPFRFLWLVTAISAGGLGMDIASREPEPPAALATLPSGEIGDASVRPLPFFFDLYTFRGENDSTTVVGQHVHNYIKLTNHLPMTSIAIAVGWASSGWNTRNVFFWTGSIFLLLSCMYLFHL